MKVRLSFSNKDKTKTKKVHKVQKSDSKMKKRFTRIREKVKVFYEEIRTKIDRSIKLEIITVVAITFVMATVLGFSVTQITRSAGVGKQYYTSYAENKRGLQERLTYFVQAINELSNREVDVSIDLGVIEQLVEKNDLKQGTYLLLEYLERCIDQVGNSYLSDYIYGEYESYKTLPEGSKAYKVYKEMKILSEADIWSEEAAKTKLRQLFDPKKILEQSSESAMKALTQEIQYELESYATQSQTYLVNSEGEALYQDGFVKKIDIAQAIRRAGEEDEEERLTSIYPVLIKGEIGYLINESSLRGAMIEYYTDTPIILGWLLGMVAFVLLIFRFTKAKIRYIEYISYCLTEISKGNLHYKVEVVGQDELAQVATDIAHMESEIRLQIEAQKQAEKVKNELITNVAHDLRTPLTSVIGYMGLLKDERYQDEEERKKYTEIAYQKAEKLKGLIEDLFEYTKLHNQEATLKMEPISLTHLLNQLAEELMPLGEERGIAIHTHIHTEYTRVMGDVQKLMRAFENLIGNAIKYSIAREDVHIYVTEVDEYVVVSVQNKCDHMPAGDLNKLFDRFYRTDASRNSETGGSGLGLAIAKNIVLLHGGQIWAEAKDQVISFNMKLRK